MREQRQKARAEWSGRCSAGVAGRGETASPIDRQCDEVMHGTTAACVARGADVVAGRQRRREVVAVVTQLSRACDASVRAPTRGAAHGVVAACATRGGWEASGARRSGNWHGRDAAVVIGVGMRSERRIGARVQASNRVGRASLRRCGLGPVSK
jgi:hypothetical protein